MALFFFDFLDWYVSQMEYKFKIYFKYIVNNIKIRIYEETIENNESPIKLFQDEEKKFIIQPYFYLICGKQDKKAENEETAREGVDIVHWSLITS